MGLICFSIRPAWPDLPSQVACSPTVHTYTHTHAATALGGPGPQPEKPHPGQLNRSGRGCSRPLYPGQASSWRNGSEAPELRRAR